MTGRPLNPASGSPHRPHTTSRSIVQEWASRSALCGPSPLRALQAPREGRWPGVRSPAHARGAPVVVHGAQRLQRRPSSRRTRTPRMGPATVPRTTCPGTGVARPHVAGHRRLQQGGGGAPGRRPHSRCPGSSRAWIVLTRLAVVGRGGAPRAGAGERGRRHRPGAQLLVGWACTDRRVSPEAPGHLPSRAGWHARSSEGPTADSNPEIEREVVSGRAVAIEAYADAFHGFDSNAPLRLRRDVPNGIHPGQGVHVGGNPEEMQRSPEAVQRLLATQ